jgi:hypothetical protein
MVRFILGCAQMKEFLNLLLSFRQNRSIGPSKPKDLSAFHWGVKILSKYTQISPIPSNIESRWKTIIQWQIETAVIARHCKCLYYQFPEIDELAIKFTDSDTLELISSASGS